MRKTFNTLPAIPPALLALKNPPEQLFYKGDLGLLDCQVKIAIVGSRSPNAYTKQTCAILSASIAKAGGVVVSGGALGVDIIAHENALPSTIMFSPSSLDIIYPKANRAVIERIRSEALMISEYESPYNPHKFSFLERNRLVIGLSDIVIIPQADLCSGSLQSARLCLESNKPLFVLPHRINESLGTQKLLAQGKAQCIYDINAFVSEIFGSSIESEDEILTFCQNAPSFELAYQKFGDKILEYELEGKIVRESGIVRVNING